MLKLNIIKSPDGVDPEQGSKTLTDQGGTIGRGDGNDWVLSDPDRYLSTRHCSLSFEGPDCYLTDLSLNGTFVNGAPQPLGKGSKTVLKDGDEFDVGDYRFRVDFSSASAARDTPCCGMKF